jgi:hypothetical protein
MRIYVGQGNLPKIGHRVADPGRVAGCSISRDHPGALAPSFNTDSRTAGLRKDSFGEKS